MLLELPQLRETRRTQRSPTRSMRQRTAIVRSMISARSCTGSVARRNSSFEVPAACVRREHRVDRLNSARRGPDCKRLASMQGVRDGPLSADQPQRPPAVCLVCDLDGTLVGQDDEGTAAFRDWWTSCGRERGSLLAYNTGRSMGQFQDLLAAKGAMMATPDVLVAGVGTRIYHYEGSSSSSSGVEAWREDQAWRRLMDHDWSLEAGLRGVQNAIRKARPERVYFKPPADQHEHKITVGLHMHELQMTLGCIRSSLQEAGADAIIITSFHGETRILDILPVKAGKLNALQYVQSSLGVRQFSDNDTVACGDSGNDILMLSGRTPGIVVGNAAADLLAWLRREGAESLVPGPEGKARLYVAKGCEARGVLEGLQFHGFF